MLVPRPALRAAVVQALRANPAVLLLGPRQCGKTTLARGIAGQRASHFFDLEDPRSTRRLEQPMSALEPLRGLVILDEVQRMPELMPVLRVLCDRTPLPARFLLLGSASPDIVRGASESLAGRVAFVDMAGFSLAEVGAASFRALWNRGGLPRSFLAPNDSASLGWRTDFVRTFLERDLRNFGLTSSVEMMRRLWTMTAHYHGQLWNGSEVGRSLGESHTSVRRHLDFLTNALVVRQLQPWLENLSKREVKSPKVYVRDSGLLHSLLGVPDFAALEANPKLGASFEGLVVEHVARTIGDRNVYFWGTQAGAELDILATVRGRRWGIEVKYADAPAMTRSMHIAIADLKLDKLFVVYPGAETFSIDQRAIVLPLHHLLRALETGKMPGERLAAASRAGARSSRSKGRR
jgi:uncharacterized protein